MSMTKLQLIAAMQEKSGLTKTQATAAYGALRAVILEQFAKGEGVKMQDFCELQVYDTKPRKLRNPQTGETFIAPAKRKVRLLPSKTMKQALDPNV